MRLSNEKAVVPMEAREIFTNHSSTLIGAKRFRGWGNLPQRFRDDDGKELVDYWVYSYSVPIAWHYADDDTWTMPAGWFSPTTEEHQRLVASALGLDFDVHAAALVGKG